MIIGGNAYVSLVARNVRRCKPKDTLVFTRLGLKKIQDVTQGEEVLTSNGYSKVTENLIQGKQELLQIKTQIGDSWCTPEHRMAVLVSPDTYVWKYARDLTNNDYLVFPTECIQGRKTQLPLCENILSNRMINTVVPDLDEDMAWFFGYFHGNGCVSRKKDSDSVHVILSMPKHSKIVEKVRKELRRFGSEPKEYEQGNCIRLKNFNKNIGLYLSQFKKSWADIDVPDFILEGSVEIRAAYLAGLFDADGTMRASKRFNVVLTSTSPSFLTQLQSVYASLGIPVKHRFIRKARKPTHKDTYELHIIGKYSKNRWQDIIGGYSLKYQPYVYSNHTNYKDDYHFPRSWFNNVEKNSSGYRIKSPYLSIDEYADRYGEYPKFIPVRVVDTEMDNGCISETFDLSVEGDHEYFCGEGLLNHNSAEIALGDISDSTFINLKNYDENPERMEIGWMSNNSVTLKAGYDFENFTHIPEMASRIRDNGEPGMINLYNIQKFGRYGKELHDDACLVNPCFGEDTLIAVADGRGCVSIRKLAEENKDVPVYSKDPVTGDISIKWGRHPRITGIKKKLTRVHFDNGTHLDVTPNHRFFLNDGRDVEARELTKGDSLPKFEVIKNESPVKLPETSRLCENRDCRAQLQVQWDQREQSYCSELCATKEREKKSQYPRHKESFGCCVSHIEELEGEHTVYNITVDDNHTVGIVTKNKGVSLTGIFTYNCGEIPLSNFETCNLSECFPPRCATPERFYQALKYCTFYSSTVSLLPTHRPESNAIIAKNRRIGVGISGIAQWASSCVPEGWGAMNYTRMTKYLRTGYKLIREENKRLAENAGVPASIRVTTVKPSGSISLLAGVTPGVHYPISRYAIRRMRIGHDSPLVKPLIEAGIPYEKDTYSDNTLVFEFVVDHGDVRPCEEVSPWEQFSLVAMMQRVYADNCVSATIYFDRNKDGSDVEKLLAMFIPILKSVSMLPHNNGVYAQAPYEKIDKNEYVKRLDSYRMPDFISVEGNVPVGSKYCSNDTCEL